MFAETGVPVLLGLFCEVNAGVLATAAGAVAAHSATAYWDQPYAEPRRRVTPVEQHVHSLLEVSPVMARFLLTALHWDQAEALAGRDRQPPRFRLRLKRRDPLSRLPGSHCSPRLPCSGCRRMRRNCCGAGAPATLSAPSRAS